MNSHNMDADERKRSPDDDEEAVSRKKAKKEKKSEKKHKHKDKHKHDQKKHKDQASDGSDSDEAQPSGLSSLWVEKKIEAPLPPAAPEIQRDDWMMTPPTRGLFGSAPKQTKNEDVSVEKFEPHVSDKELNPYLRDGGSGVPDSSVQTASTVQVGDGGLGWRKNKLKRAEQLASDTNRTLEDVWIERNGSLDSLLAIQEEIKRHDERRHHSHHRHHHHQQRHDDRDNGDRHDRRDRWRNERNDDDSNDREKRDRRDDRKDDRRHDRRSNVDHTRDTDTRDTRDTRDTKDTRDRGDSEDKELTRHRTEDSRQQRPSRDYLANTRSKMLMPTERDSNRTPVVESVSSSEPEQKPSFSSAYLLPVLPPVLPPAPQEGQSQDAPVPVDLNKLTAKLLRAEIQGNTELVNQLKAQIAAAEQAAAALPPSGGQDDEETQDKRVVVLHGFNQQGRPQAIPSKPSMDNKPRKKKIETHDQDGKRIRYFRDDDEASLDDLVRREKMTSGSNAFDEQLADQIARNTRFQDSLDYMDETSEQLADVKANNTTATKLALRARETAIKDHKRVESQLNSCFYCLDSPALLKHLIISSGVRTYLTLPERGVMTPGHCLIVPVPHVTSTLNAEEDVWTELRNFKKCLIKMFAKEKRGVVFLEMATQLRLNRHTFIEVIPLPMDKFDEAPMYFKKAILESDEVWSQNTKLIDTAGRGLRRSVPPRFPYFHVEFGLDRGFAHVIESEEKFPRNFGKEVCGGMLEATPDVWLRPKKQTPDQERKRLQDFKKQWEPFNWTKQLDQSTEGD